MTRHLRSVTGPDEKYPWERLDGETAKAFQSFQVYLDLGPRRSLRKVKESGNGSTSQRVLEDWSARFNWVARCTSADGWRAGESRLDEQDALNRMRRTHALVGQASVAKAGERIRQIDPKTLTVRDATALLKLGFEMERISRGEATSIVDQRGDAALRATLTGKDILALIASRPEIAQLADALSDVIDLTAEES